MMSNGELCVHKVEHDHHVNDLLCMYYLYVLLGVLKAKFNIKYCVHVYKYIYLNFMNACTYMCVI